MLYTGLRKGELLALEWNDVDLNAALLTVNKSAWFDNNRVGIKVPKTEAGFRTVPIPALILPILREAKEKASSTFVCPSAQGKRMTHTAYNAAWTSYLGYLNLKAGGRRGSRSNAKLQLIEEFTAHQLRHTYASMLYDAGVDPKSAQKFLGHADLQVTLKIYTHLSAEKENGSVAALNRFLSSGDGLGADAVEKNACEGNVGGNKGSRALDLVMPFSPSSFA
jgi:integrase